MGWIVTVPALALRQAIRLGQLAVGPEQHVMLVIARAASQARMRRARNAASLSISRTEQ
jgi:hypothetical protein